MLLSWKPAGAAGQHRCRRAQQPQADAHKPSMTVFQSLTQQRQRTTCHGVIINTDTCTADTWSMPSRAAMLSLKVEELEGLIGGSNENAWMAVCSPERLFALREVCALLSADVKTAVQLVRQEPALLDVPAKALEDNIRGVQALLQLPRPSLLQLLYAAPSLAVSGPRAVEEQLQRVAWGLGLSAAGPEAASLLQVLPALGMDALLDPQLAVQRVSPFLSALSVQPAAALALLQAEAAAGHDLQGLLTQPALGSLSQQWRVLSEELKVPLTDLMAALAEQVVRPDARYLVTSPQQLRADITALHAACQLQQGTVCRMLLAAPRLSRVPASFWQLLLQYILFLVPQWRQELSSMGPEAAGAVLAQLFDTSGGDMLDSVAVSPREALFTTADSDYNQELQVLEALLDQGLPAPRFATPGQVAAGRVWRLIYICNPRLSAAHQASRDPSANNTSADGPSPWSWLLKLQLPTPLLLSQPQQQGAAVRGWGVPIMQGAISSSSSSSSSELDSKGGMSAGRVAAERVESLVDVIGADAGGFNARHPGYAHWLHNAAFELEWAGSKATAHVTTWDP